MNPDTTCVVCGQALLQTRSQSVCRVPAHNAIREQITERAVAIMLADFSVNSDAAVEMAREQVLGMLVSKGA